MQAYSLLILTVILTALTTTPAFAEQNEVPSCYAAYKVKHYTAPYSREVYVLLDQTVNLDKTLKRSVLTNLANLIQPGTRFVVTEFSAFSQGRYTQVVTRGIVESPVPKDHIGEIVMSRLQPFQNCLKQQLSVGRRMAVMAAWKAMNSSASSLDHSDILMALNEVAPAIRNDKASKKVLFLVSDGLENSSVTSFYHHGTIRKLNDQRELDLVKKSHLIPQLGDVKVYVLGGAMLPPSKKGSRAAVEGYRDPQTLMDLKGFWQGYFSQAGATLAEFGEPALLEPAQY